jgi:hypothetical protein
VHRQELGTTLDLERFHRTGRNPGAGSSHQAPVNVTNPRVRVLKRPPSPSLDSPAYWPMEPSDPITSSRGRQEPPCAVYSWGPCPYPASRRLRFSSLGHGEGGEGNADEEEDNEDPIKIFPVLDSPSRLAPIHITQIQVRAQGRPTGTLAPRSGAREPEGGSPVTRFTVWPPPPLQDEDTITTAPSPYHRTVD